MKQLRQPYTRHRQQVETPGTMGAIRLKMWKPNAGFETASSGWLPGTQQQSLTTMTDVVTPGFAQRVASGAIVNSPMSMVSTLWGPSIPGSMIEFDKTNEDLRWGAEGDSCRLLGWPSPASAGLRTTNLIRLAQTAALAGVKAPDLYTGVALGEGLKTLNLAVSPFRGLARLIANSANRYRRDLKLYGNELNSVMKIKGHTRRQKRLVEFKRKVKDTRTRDPINVDNLEFIPDMVLAYNLGWKPLLKDIDALLRKIPAKTNPERVTSRATKSETASSTVPGTSGDYTQGCRLAYNDTITETVTVRCGVLYETGGEQPRADFGVRLSDVPITAWELVPFSFLLDYVVNVGNWLEAIAAPSRAKILAFYTLTTTQITVERVASHGIPGTGWTVVRQPGGSTAVSTLVKTRDVAPFGASISHTPITLVNRPVAQMQNVLSLVTKSLYGASIWKAR